MKLLWCLTFVITLAAWAFAEGAEEMAKKYDIEEIKNVIYTQGDEKPQMLDILSPKQKLEEPMPVLVWIHGGGWVGGNKMFARDKIRPFAEKGYFCISIEYRLAPDSIFPAQIEDCKCAIRYLRAHAKKYNLDTDHIGVWGSSAGSHLASLLGTTTGVEELEGDRGWKGFSSEVHAVCNDRGPTDITKMGHLPQAAKLLGGEIKDKTELAVKASPVTYVSKDDTPFLIIQGTKDILVPYEQATILKEALEKVGVPVELITIKGAGHGSPKLRSPKLLQKIMAFFDTNLKPKSPK